MNITPTLKETKTFILELLLQGIFALPGVLLILIQGEPTIANTLIGTIVLLLLKAVDRAINESKRIKAKGLITLPIK